MAHKGIEIVEFASGDIAEACRLVKIKTPKPGQDELLVKMLCRPVQPVDILLVRGKYHGKLPPCPVGVEGAGRVHEVGGGVTSYQVGQLVNVCKLGTWQEYMLVSTQPRLVEHVFSLPESIPLEAASQFYGNPWTAYGLLDVLSVPRGEYLLQTAAASTVGKILIQLARHKGIKTINLVRRNEQKEELKAIGADFVINFKEEDVPRAVAEITGGKLAYGAAECIGGEFTRMVASCVRESGTVLVYGMLEDTSFKLDMTDVLFRDVRIHGFTLSRYVAGLGREGKNGVAKSMIELMENKIIGVASEEGKFRLEDFKQALQKYQANTGGRKVFLMSDE